MSALHVSLSCGSTPNRSHSLTSFFTYLDHLFLGLPRPLVSGLTNCYIGNKFATRHGTLYTARQSEPPTSKDWGNSLNTKCLEGWNRWSFLAVFSVTDLAKHGLVIVVELLQPVGIQSSRFTTMEHSRAEAGRVHFTAHLTREVPDHEDRQEFHDLSPGHVVCSMSQMAPLIGLVGGLSKYFFQGFSLAALSAAVIGRSINRPGVALIIRFPSSQGIMGQFFLPFEPEFCMDFHTYSRGRS